MGEGRKSGAHLGVQLMLRVTPELHERLATEAAKRDRSMAWLARHLLEESLGRLIPADELRLTMPLADPSRVVPNG